MDNILGIGRTIKDTTPEFGKLKNIIALYGLPHELVTFYSKLSHDETIIVNEFHFNTIDALNEAYQEVYDAKLRNEEITATFNIGYKYTGMGNTCILVYDPRVQKYYFRHDGGSDGWDRERVYKFFEGTDFDPRSQQYAKQVFCFDTALKHLIYNDFEYIMIMDP